MLKAARAQGMPTMVIAMITAAISQPMAIQMPPKIIHNRLSSSDRGDMVVLPLGALLAYLNFAYLNDGGERLLTNPTVIQATCRAFRDGGCRPPARYGCK
jgi:hypothetical protein